VAASAATLAFAWQPGITAITSDEVSYVALARLFVSGEPWGRHLATFPPLFPLLLAGTGAAYDLTVAHVVVAVFAALALPLVYWHASRVLGSAGAGLAVVAAFLLTPSAWLAAKPIGSEPAFLVATLAALCLLEARAGASARDRWVLGLALAAAVSLRTAGFALVAAYAANVLIDARKARRAPDARAAIPIVLAIVAAAAWIALRPLEGRDLYAINVSAFAHRWLADPAGTFVEAARALGGGWIATFALDSTAPVFVAAGALAAGALALAGTWMRVAANRVDGWYVVFSIAVLAPMYFGEQTARRYLHPLLPVLLVHAAVALGALTARMNPRARAGVLAAAFVLPAAVCATSLATIATRAADRAPVLEGFTIRWSDLIDYYIVRDEARARESAAANAGVLAGFDAVDRATPPGARVMWMRPEYVAVLARRPAAAWFYADDEARLARAIESQAVDYVALSGIVKSDLDARQGDQAAVARALARFASPVVEIPNAVQGRPEFVLLKVDREAVRAYLASRA